MSGGRAGDELSSAYDSNARTALDGRERRPNRTAAAAAALVKSIANELILLPPPLSVPPLQSLAPPLLGQFR